MADTTLADALSLITKVSSTTNKRLTLLEKVIGKKAPALKQSASSKPVAASNEKSPAIGQPPVSKKPRKVVEKASPVIVTDFGKKAEQDLGRMAGDPGQGGKGGEGGKSGGGLGKLTAAALLVLGGVAALVTGLMSDGPLKGFLKILAKGGIIGGIKLFKSMVSKSLGKFTAGFAKLLPKGIFTKVITKVKTFMKSIGKFFLKPFKMLGKGGAKGIFGKILGMMFKFIKPVLKRIPGIGSLISWGFAISRFKKGDVVGGLIDVASGIATIFPGIGTGISIGLDVLNAFLDAKKGKEEKVEPGGAPGGIGAFFGKIKDKIMNNFPIKNLVSFYSGVGKVLTGNFKEGFHQMAFAIPFMKPLANFLFGEREEVDSETGVVTKKPSLAKALKAGIMDKLRQFWKGAAGWVKWGAKKLLPDNIIKMLESGGGSAPDDPTEDDYNAEMSGGSSSNSNRGRRKDGGPVKKNQEYIVGEEGPELFVPDSDGSIKTNKETQTALGSTAIVKGLDNNSKLIGKIGKTNVNLLKAQLKMLEESTDLLRQIAEKGASGGNNIISTNNTSVTNMNNQRNLRDLQEMYA